MKGFDALLWKRRRVIAPIAGTMIALGLVGCSEEAGQLNTNTKLPTVAYETVREGQPNYDAATGIFDSTETVRSKVDNETEVRIHRTLGCEGILLRYIVSIEYGAVTEPVFAVSNEAMICEDEYIGAAEANEIFERLESDPYLGQEFIITTGSGFDHLVTDEAAALDMNFTDISRQNF